MGAVGVGGGGGGEGGGDLGMHWSLYTAIEGRTATQDCGGENAWGRWGLRSVTVVGALRAAGVWACTEALYSTTVHAPNPHRPRLPHGRPQPLAPPRVLTSATLNCSATLNALHYVPKPGPALPAPTAPTA